MTPGMRYWQFGFFEVNAICSINPSSRGVETGAWLLVETKGVKTLTRPASLVKRAPMTSLSCSRKVTKLSWVLHVTKTEEMHRRCEPVYSSTPSPLPVTQQHKILICLSATYYFCFFFDHCQLFHTQSDDSHLLYHFQYRRWGETGLPQAHSLVYLQQQLHKVQLGQEHHGPIIIHCRYVT